MPPLSPPGQPMPPGGGRRPVPTRRTTARAFRIALALLAATLAGCQAAPEVRIALESQTVVDLDVHLDDDQPGRVLEILPGETKTFDLRSPLWIDFGMNAQEYDLSPVAELDEPLVRLQAREDGRLYWMEPDSPPGSEPPESQPPGFPLAPTGIVDLT